MKHACARCGKKLPAEKMIFSRHTRARYCIDLAGCDRRAAKRRKTSPRPSSEPMGAAA